MELALATNNYHKVKEIKAILGDRFEKLYTLKDLNIDIEIEETGDTLSENSLIKASTISKLTGMVAIADDSGLMVDSLDGAPGVYSARYAGEEHDDKKNNELLIKNLDGKDRSAHFCSVVTLYFPDGHYIQGEGKVEGEILFEEHGNNGFGYDPLFYSYELKKAFAEATPDEKNSVSHRGRALKDLLSKLNWGIYDTYNSSFFR